MKNSEIRTLFKRCKFKGPKNYYHFSTTPNGRTVLCRYNSRNFVKTLGAAAVFRRYLYNVDFENNTVNIKSSDSKIIDIFYSNIPLDYFIEFCKTKILHKKHEDLAQIHQEFFSKYTVF